jgi:N-methylhydantoinase A
MISQANPCTLRIGIDIGGTFTDFVIINSDNQQVETFKILSTPHDPSEAVLAGLSQIETHGISLSIIHGSTVATNALLERKGARTALVATQGFGDVIQIGRQNRPELYDLVVRLPSPLVPEELRFEVEERVSAEGEILVKLLPEAVDELVNKIQQAGVESVALCLLFSFLRPEHEMKLAEALRKAGVFVSASSEILPEFREFERMSTTTVNAYVSPVLDRYLAKLQEHLISQKKNKASAHIRVMQSNGGAISLEEARKSGVRCILSGPAGGVIGAQFIAEKALPKRPINLLTFDMGGTSTDVSLIVGKPQLTSDSVIGGAPIRIPVLDIHTIGAGGGSIAAVDAGGSLRVGPQSAGANPGPACYGLVDPERDPSKLLATVTDANLVLGRLAPELFLGGKMPLKPELARRAIDRIAENLTLDRITTALGIIEVANAHMERALRVISVERGHDPRDFTLLSFGGAGGLHASDLAHHLSIPLVIFPPYASTLSALGMLAARVIKDYSRTVMLRGDTSPESIQNLIQPLIEQARFEMAAEGVSISELQIALSLDMRYRGQSYELSVPWSDINDDFRTNFHAIHQQTYGYANPSSDIEIVNLRARAAGSSPEIFLKQKSNSENGSEAPPVEEHREVYLKGSDGIAATVDTPFYRWEQLNPGNNIDGPALIVRNDTTILLNKRDHGILDSFMNLIVTIGR